MKRPAKGKKLTVHESMLVEVRFLNPAAYNPRTITLLEFEALKASIRDNGFLDPVIVQKTTMNIIGGHQRVKAVKEICVEDGITVPKLPCIVLDIDDRQAKKLNVLLNKVKGDFDNHLLGELLAEINRDEKITEDEYHHMGFDDVEAVQMRRLMGETMVDLSPAPAEQGSTFGKSVTFSVPFSDVRIRDAVKKTLKEKADIVQKSVGDYLAEILGVKVA